jgi:hypothetical protein
MSRGGENNLIDLLEATGRVLIQDSYIDTKAKSKLNKEKQRWNRIKVRADKNEVSVNLK